MEGQQAFLPPRLVASEWPAVLSVFCESRRFTSLQHERCRKQRVLRMIDVDPVKMDGLVEAGVALTCSLTSSSFQTPVPPHESLFILVEINAVL